MIKAVIIDDEPVAANVLRLMIERYIPEITEVHVETKGENAVAVLQALKPQLVFLDIVMPVLTGFDLLRQFEEIPFSVIFTTAHDEYAIQAIRFSAVDYLLKPIDADELQAAVKRYISIAKTEVDSKAILQNLAHNLQVKNTHSFKLAVPVVGGAVFFSPDEIIRLEGESNYSWIMLTNNRRHLSSKTIKDYEGLLDANEFIRVHKSHLINKKYVVGFKKEGEIILSDKATIPVSRRKRKEVMEALVKQKA